MHTSPHSTGEPLGTRPAVHDPVSLEAIRDLVADDLQRIDALIQQNLHSEVPLIRQLGQHIINSGGKRLRPILLVLSSKLFGYQGNQHHQLAVIIEFIHTATLLHDDVVDASLLRRGKATANQCWGNEASVLVGDFVYSRAFQMMVDLGSMPIMRILADTTNTIACGEVEQLTLNHNPATDEATCLRVIHNKTARLFEAAAQLGALLSGGSEQAASDMARYGAHLGVAFQLIDDVLDYSACAGTLGKNICDDLSEGKPTIPLLYAMHHGSRAQAQHIRRIIETGGSTASETIQAAVRDSGALEYTAALADKQVQLACQALARLPASPCLDALYQMTQFALRRDN